MKKEIILTQGYVALVDDDMFEYLNQFKWYVVADIHTMYAMRKINKNTIYMHREILGMDQELSTDQLVDHINHNGLNNLRSNLRICTRSQNAMNRGRIYRNKTGFKGVYFDNDLHKYRSQIKYNGTLKYLGCFSSPEDAAKAYDRAAIEFFGEFAYRNFDE